MKKFDTRTYSISDFLEWRNTGSLELSPSFQRRSVWTLKAKSYLLDTILRGKPMPKVLIQHKLIDSRTIREVIDGQQRLRSILEFIDGDFSVSRTHNQKFGGDYYSDLPPEVQKQILQYEIGVDVIFDASFSDLLDIFARLNTYSVKLNTTELLNAKYLGTFKITAHTLGHRYAEYLLEAKILSSAKIARMAEVELTADILGAILDGISAKKNIESFYKKYEDEDQGIVKDAEDIFDNTMHFWGKIYNPSDLANSNFSRVHLFYSAFLALSSILSGKPRLPGVITTTKDLHPSRVRIALDNISAEYDERTSGSKSSALADEEIAQFVENSRRATTDQAVRIQRSSFIARRILDSIQ